MVTDIGPVSDSRATLTNENAAQNSWEGAIKIPFLDILRATADEAKI
jgi:hypothetical protein